MTEPPNAREHRNLAVLRAIYADLASISDYASDDVVLHAAERDLPGAVASYHGARSVRARELELIRRTDETLSMDVEFACAGDYFGAVCGVLRATVGGAAIEMPFCGVWRFRDGLVVEHWENAYDPAALAGVLARHSA